MEESRISNYNIRDPNTIYSCPAVLVRSNIQHVVVDIPMPTSLQDYVKELTIENGFEKKERKKEKRPQKLIRKHEEEEDDDDDDDDEKFMALENIEREKTQINGYRSHIRTTKQQKNIQTIQNVR